MNFSCHRMYRTIGTHAFILATLFLGVNHLAGQVTESRDTLLASLSEHFETAHFSDILKRVKQEVRLAPAEEIMVVFDIQYVTGNESRPRQ